MFISHGNSAITCAAAAAGGARGCRPAEAGEGAQQTAAIAARPGAGGRLTPTRLGAPAAATGVPVHRRAGRRGWHQHRDVQKLLLVGFGTSGVCTFDTFAREKPPVSRAHFEPRLAHRRRGHLLWTDCCASQTASPWLLSCRQRSWRTIETEEPVLELARYMDVAGSKGSAADVDSTSGKNYQVIILPLYLKLARYKRHLMALPREN